MKSDSGLVGEIRLSDTEVVRVRFRLYGDTPYLDVRLWTFSTGNPNYAPSHKGVCLNPKKASNLIKVLQRAAKIIEA